MLQLDKAINMTPNKQNNDSSIKNDPYQKQIQKASPALVFCNSLSEINTKNENGWTPIYQSIFSNNLEALYDLLKLGADPDIPNNLGETPLYLSVDINNYDALIILLQYNANCNIAKKNGNTPLHLATKKNQITFISALLRNNADPNIVNKLYSQTPIHLAIINKVEENILVEFNMSKADIYNIKDKYDKSPFDYAKEVGDQNYINLLKKIFGEDNNILNGSEKQRNKLTSNPGEYNKKESPVKKSNEYKNNSNFEINKNLFSFEENYLNKDNSSIIIKSIENNNILLNGNSDSKEKLKDNINKENIEFNSNKDKSKMSNEKINEELKMNINNNEKTEENKNNSTDTIKKLSLSHSSEMNLKFENDKNKTISYNKKTNKNENINNKKNSSFLTNHTLKNKNSNNSISSRSIKKDISEMNPLDMINQVITTSSMVFSELQINSNNNRTNQSDEYFNNKSGRENISTINNLMINDSLEYSKTNTHIISDISSKNQINDKIKTNTKNIENNNQNGLNITINEYEEIKNNNNNSNNNNLNRNKQIIYHKQNPNENKENVNLNTIENRNNIINKIDNNKKILGGGTSNTNQNDILTQNSTSQGENVITKIKYFNAAPNLPELQKERIPQDILTEEDHNKFINNNNNIYNIKSYMERQSTMNTISNNLSNKGNKYTSLKLSELENNTNSFLLKNLNKSEEISICSPQNIKNEILSRLRDWLISCDLLCYYNLLIKNNMYDIDFYIKNLKSNTINISYKDIEDIGIKKPGHIFRFLLRLQIDSGILDENMCNLIINKFNSNLLTTIGLTASTNIFKCCGMTLYRQNGEESSNPENTNICCTLPDSDNNNCYKDIFGFLKYKGLMKYKENFIHNGFDQIDYIIIQLFSYFKFNKETLNDYLHIYSESDQKKVIKKLYEEKRKIALELALPYDLNEEEIILNSKIENNDISKNSDTNKNCIIF